MAQPVLDAGRSTSVTRTSADSHRLDLNGLRGVAIMLVACFHIWFGRVSGGVDVFLVLSGYFFVGSLLRQVTAAQDPAVRWWTAATPVPRLIRLARRLVPTLAVVLIAVVIGTVLVLPQTRWLATGREVVASALYYQNWYLAFNSQDYTAASSVNSPLQHVWSMAVQGQFFVVTLVTALGIGVLLKLGARTVLPALSHPVVLRVVAGIAIVGVASISLYWATMRMAVNQPFNYYDTIARSWEPLAGGLLAVWAPMIARYWLRSALAIGGLGLILSSGWWIDGLSSYPGPWALVPVLATMALILSGSTGPTNTPNAPPRMNRLLATAIPVWLGSIAYALYLWHWPVLIFYLSWSNTDQAGAIGGLLVLAVSIALAWLTYRFVEEPLRASPTATRSAHPVDTGTGGERRPRQLVTQARMTAAVLLVGVLVSGVAIEAWDRHVSNIRVDTTNLDPAVYPGARAFLDDAPVASVDPQPSPLEVGKDLPITSFEGYISDFTDPAVRVGTYGDPTAPRTIALAGGSHAEFWITALDALGKQNNFKVMTYLKMGCPLSTDPVPKQRGVPYPGCFDWVQRVMPQIIADRPDAVFTNTTRPRDNASGDWVPPTYVPIFAQFAAAGIPVLGMRDTVWPHNADGPIDSPSCLAEGGSADDCGTPRSMALEPSNPTLAILGTNPNILPLDLSEGLCTTDMCPAVIGNTVVYNDWHHLSATFVRSLAPELWRQMNASLPWLRP